MTSPDEYKRQIEAGKEIVKGILRDLATNLDDLRIANLTLVESHSDFDKNGMSLLDPSTGRIVARLKLEHLADAPGTPSRRRQLNDEVRREVIGFFSEE
jgi:hypothetical protein